MRMIFTMKKIDPSGELIDIDVFVEEAAEQGHVHNFTKPQKGTIFLAYLRWEVDDKLGDISSVNYTLDEEGFHILEFNYYDKSFLNAEVILAHYVFFQSLQVHQQHAKLIVLPHAITDDLVKLGFEYHQQTNRYILSDEAFNDLFENNVKRFFPGL